MSTSSEYIEYVIVIYAKGTVTTVIGFADEATARQALLDNCTTQHAQWGHLFRGDGSLICSYP
ncbi:hypothetical protein [Halioxenophilus sp. WMMB6]|uniref:hypothetical protein n=1 Tax=Halioxenophilus sp. WMMB6 TaxID=3073815 RepID=UPI00295E7DEF|nr:hypothetical protein [Halioxenophilus sp. WMMB6]